jgi:hypothetical protein
MTIGTVRALSRALGMPSIVSFGWRGPVERLIDEGHPAMVEFVLAHLEPLGWTVVPEFSFNHFGERGCVDVLAWHAYSRALLVIETKTRIGISSRCWQRSTARATWCRPSQPGHSAGLEVSLVSCSQCPTLVRTGVSPNAARRPSRLPSRPGRWPFAAGSRTGTRSPWGLVLAQRPRIGHKTMSHGAAGMEAGPGGRTGRGGRAWYLIPVRLRARARDSIAAFITTSTRTGNFCTRITWRTLDKFGGRDRVRPPRP